MWMQLNVNSRNEISGIVCLEVGELHDGCALEVKYTVSMVGLGWWDLVGLDRWDLAGGTWWDLVGGTWLVGLGRWDLVGLDRWDLACGTWSVGLGPWDLVGGTWLVGLGWWDLGGTWSVGLGQSTIQQVNTLGALEPFNSAEIQHFGHQLTTHLTTAVITAENLPSLNHFNDFLENLFCDSCRVESNVH